MRADTAKLALPKHAWLAGQVAICPTAHVAKRPKITLESVLHGQKKVRRDADKGHTKKRKGKERKKRESKGKAAHYVPALPGCSAIKKPSPPARLVAEAAAIEAANVLRAPPWNP